MKKSLLNAPEPQSGISTPFVAKNQSASKCRGLNDESLPTLVTAINLDYAIKNFQHQKDASKPKTSVITVAVEGAVNNVIETPEGNIPIIQRVTEEALYNLVSNFNKELLIDLEHNSENGGSTEAAGWIKRLELGADHNTVVAEVEWTPLGVEKLTGKNYKYLSPVYLGANLEKEGDNYIFNVTTLKSVGLTNRPNIKELGEISLNRAQLPDSDQTKPNNEMKLTKVTLTTLGLPETATEQEVENAVVALNTRATESEEQVTALNKSVLEADKQRFPNALKADGASENFETLHALNRDACLTQFTATENALVAVTNAGAGKRTPQVTAANAKQPDVDFHKEESGEFDDEALIAAANSYISKGEETDLVVAYNRAKSEAGK